MGPACQRRGRERGGQIGLGDRGGPASWRVWAGLAAEKKREKEKETGAGLKQERGGEKVFHFLEKKQTHSN